MGASHHKRLPSSTEVDVIGTSVLNSQTLPKQESSTATSKNYTFKEGIFFQNYFTFQNYTSFSKKNDKIEVINLNHTFYVYDFMPYFLIF